MIEPEKPTKPRDLEIDRAPEKIHRTKRVNKRQFNKMQHLSDQGKRIPYIAKVMKLDKRTVAKYLELRQIDRITALLRKFIYNPRFSVPPGDIRYPLEVNGQDWRLDPITWFHLCTPDFSEDAIPYWEETDSKFMKNLKRTQFWVNFTKLKYEVFKLQKDYENAVQELLKNDDELKEFWTNLQNDRIRYLPPSRTPQFPEPDWDEWEVNYSQEQCDKVLDCFSSLIPDIHDRLISLDDKLQRLYDILS